MWIKREEYNVLKTAANKLEDAQRSFLSEVDIHRTRLAMAQEKNLKISEELYEIKKELEHYLNTNEEKGVVYIPKFVIEKIVHGF